MMDEEQEISAIEMRLTLPALRLLLNSVETELRQWPGGDAEEQLALVALKHLLMSAIFELLYDLD
tara:strand:- start:7065 stop:7259 length:195 start_codon:yes stop_codon:yes gene_type:complete